MTNITRWNPFDELSTAWPRSFFGRDFLTRLRPSGEMAFEWSPTCDVTESEGEVVINAELPGVESKDIDVQVTGNKITIRGEKRSETSEEKEGRSYQERFFGSFERSLLLPDGIDADRVQARLKDGVLEVRVPRVAPVAPEAKKVEISVG